MTLIMVLYLEIFFPWKWFSYCVLSSSVFPAMWFFFVVGVFYQEKSKPRKWIKRLSAIGELSSSIFFFFDYSNCWLWLTIRLADLVSTPWQHRPGRQVAISSRDQSSLMCVSISMANYLMQLYLKLPLNSPLSLDNLLAKVPSYMCN